MATINHVLMTGDVSVLDAFDCVSLDTNGAARSVSGLDGTGYPDGATVKIVNVGADDLTLVDGAAVGAGNVLYLPSSSDVIVTDTGLPYELTRNDNGPRGDGWYGA